MKIECLDKNTILKTKNKLPTIESKDALKQFKNIINRPDIGFFNLVQDPLLCNEATSLYNDFAHKKHFVHVGIGGSSLGPEMLITSLAKSDVQFTFINNIDPDTIRKQLDSITNIDETLFYIVSKSGGTAETMAVLSIIFNELENKFSISTDIFKNYLVFCTDPLKGDLRDLAKNLSINYLTIPSNIGGRFSVLTNAGIFPALFGKISIEQIIKGAQDICEVILQENNNNNPLFKTTQFLLKHKANNCSQTVLMPYSSRLKCLSSWFVQLWAESLGKKNNLEGEVVFEGLTPIPAYGATDQHSQVQLFMEGPRDKVIIIIEVDQFKNDYYLKSNYTSPSLTKLSPFKLSQLFKAELEGTLKALEEEARPLIHIKIPTVDEYYLGQLILLFESMTALMGGFLKIDPFNQPGVEAGKKYAFEWLQNPSP